MTPYVQSLKTRQQAIPEPGDDLRRALMAKPYEIDLAGKDIAQAVQCSRELGGFIASLTCDRVHNGQFTARFAWGSDSSLIAAQKPSSSGQLNRGTVALVRNQLAAISELPEQPRNIPLLDVGQAAKPPTLVVSPVTPQPTPLTRPASPTCHDCGQPYEGDECWLCAPLARAMLAVRRKRRDRQLQKRFPKPFQKTDTTSTSDSG